MDWMLAGWIWCWLVLILHKSYCIEDCSCCSVISGISIKYLPSWWAGITRLASLFFEISTPTFPSSLRTPLVSRVNHIMFIPEAHTFILHDWLTIFFTFFPSPLFCFASTGRSKFKTIFFFKHMERKPIDAMRYHYCLHFWYYYQIHHNLNTQHQPNNHE